MRISAILLLSLLAGPCWAAEAMVVDGNTLILKGTTYRLDGVMAPQTDQVCLDEKGARWACGIAARDRLRNFVGKSDVQCSGSRTDFAYRNRLMEFA